MSSEHLLGSSEELLLFCLCKTYIYSPTLNLNVDALLVDNYTINSLPIFDNTWVSIVAQPWKSFSLNHQPNMSTTSSSTPPSASFLGVHHFKFAATDIDRTVAFYTTHLPFTHLPHLDHKKPASAPGPAPASTSQTTTIGGQSKDTITYAKILQHSPSSAILEIRHAPQRAIQDRGWNPITWAVRGRADLQDWHAYFVGVGVKCSRVLKGVKGWVLCAEDPDGRHVRLYTLEEHEMTSEVDRDEYWLAEWELSLDVVSDGCWVVLRLWRMRAWVTLIEEDLLFFKKKEN